MVSADPVARPMRVVIADDHAHVRGQVRAALEEGGLDVAGEGATADQAVALALAHRPDVALLDIHMPGSGIHAARRITREVPGTIVVMLTQSGDDEDLFDSLRAGASGYLLKSGDPAKLPHALRGVVAGEAALPPALVARVIQEFRRPRSRLPRRSAAAARLSERELEVMELLQQGLTTDEVAQRLYLSPTTVRVHVSTVLRKLRVKDRKSAFALLQDE
jgi:DNA-binding NarL/FixJ family response regulator